MANQRQILHTVRCDFNHPAFRHSKEEKSITMVYDESIQSNDGTLWRSKSETPFHYGMFSARIKCPGGDTSGLVSAFYLSSKEDEAIDKDQDEIDFEFVGDKRNQVQTNYFVEGVGGNEEHIEFLFDTSHEFHEYTIYWTPEKIQWFIDGVCVRKVEMTDPQRFPQKPMYLYGSLWKGTNCEEWTGPYRGTDEPYTCHMTHVRVP